MNVFKKNYRQFTKHLQVEVLMTREVTVNLQKMKMKMS